MPNRSQAFKTLKKSRAYQQTSNSHTHTHTHRSASSELSDGSPHEQHPADHEQVSEQHQPERSAGGIAASPSERHHQAGQQAHNIDEREVHEVAILKSTRTPKTRRSQSTRSRRAAPGRRPMRDSAVEPPPRTAPRPAPNTCQPWHAATTRP